MNALIVMQLVVIAASIYYIYRGARKLPKQIAYSIYGILGVLTVTIILVGVYRPELLQRLTDTLNIAV